MSLFDLSQAGPVGPGRFAAAGSIQDAELARQVAGYKRTIASRYRALRPEELDQLPRGGLFVSPKIDGEIWFLVVEGDEHALVAPNGKVLSGDLPVLREAKELVVPRARGRLVLAGELFALRKEGRPRHGDVRRALSGGVNAEVQRVGFHAFDLLEGGDADDPGPKPLYADRLACLRRLTEGGKRLQTVKTEEVEGAAAVRERYDAWVEGGKGEGLVVRSAEIGRIYKVKPVFTLDAAVIGYTVRSDEPAQVRSLLLALLRDEGQFHIVGSCGNMGTGDDRAALFARLAPDVVESAFSYASSSGALFQFVRPRLVVEVKCTDLQDEDSAGRPVQRMVLELGGEAGEEKWTPIAPLPGVSVLHPVLSRVREDKQVDATDVRATQVLERVDLADVTSRAETRAKAASEVLLRRVWTKTTKEKLAVRKVVAWRTGKEDAGYPAFVVHWTDYSPGRKDPLKREVRLAPDETTARVIADDLVAAGIKRGWKEVE